jgi:hypothetical protein
MGASEWRAHGVKYGHRNYFEQEIRKQIKEEVLAKLHEITEIYIGMEGCKPVTAPEAYQQQVLRDMYLEIVEMQKFLDEQK